MKKLDLDVIEMVVAVADTGSFARGAESVHRSASAVSMQIKALEASLGKPLFVRTTRHVTITAEGKTLLDHGRRMLAMREEAWASIVRPVSTNTNTQNRVCGTAVPNATPSSAACSRCSR